MPVCDLERLSTLPLFHGFTPAQLVCVQAALRCITYPAGTDILTLEQCSEMVYILLSGSVKIYIHRPHSAEMILNILGVGEVLGELSAVDGLSHSANVMTLETSIFARMEQAAFSSIFHEMPDMSANLVRILTRRLRSTTSKAEALATLDVKGRCASQLLNFAQDYGRPTGSGGIIIPIRLTQGNLASLVCASREKVNHIMVYWKHQKYISTTADHYITVHNLPALSQCCR